MLICLSITQILKYVYSIVDADLYTIREEMFTLVELHSIQTKCVNNTIKEVQQYLAGDKEVKCLIQV